MIRTIRRKLTLTMGIVISSIFLVSCQPTPSVSAVVNRSQGLPEGAAIPAIADSESKEIDAPTVWTVDIVEMDGNFVIKGEAPVSIPEISNTPVVEIEQIELTNEKLNEMVRFFARSQKLYMPIKMTKQEIETHIGYIEEGTGVYGNPNNRWVSEMSPEKEKERAEELLGVASDSAVKMDDDIIAFGNYQQEDADYIWKDTNSDMYPQQVSYSAYIETGERIDPKIVARNKSEETSYGSLMEYSKGRIVSESEVAGDKTLPELQQAGSVEEIQDPWLKSFAEQIERREAELSKEPGITLEQALSQAEQALAGLGAEDMGLFKTEKGIQELLTPQEQLLHEYVGAEPSVPGYYFEYVKENKGLKSYPLTDGSYMRDSVNEVYKPPFYPETIKIFVTADGVQYFSWKEMAEVRLVIAENTQLLPFEEAAKRYTDHLYYNAVKQLDEFVEAHKMDDPNFDESKANSLLEVSYTVKSVTLTSAYVTAYNNPDAAWLIPVWVFEADMRSKGRDLPTDFTRISALDGSYITMLL